MTSPTDQIISDGNLKKKTGHALKINESNAHKAQDDDDKSNKKRKSRSLPGGLVLAVHRKELGYQVRLFDKIRLTFGISILLATEYLFLRRSNIYPLCFWIQIFFMMGMRYRKYYSLKYHLYLIDFCYWVSASLYIQQFVVPTNIRWFKINFILTQGPLIMAISLWKNSLVFHDFDKLMSFYVHFGPALITHQIRWRHYNFQLNIPENEALGMSEVSGAIQFYLAWQVIYYFITDVLLRRTMRDDPEVQTSLRYFLSKQNHPICILTYRIFVAIGILKKDDNPDPDSISTKVFYSLLQLLYTLLSLLVTPILWKYYSANVFALIASLQFSVWNGANFYIEQFSRKYVLKFMDEFGFRTLPPPQDEDEQESTTQVEVPS